MLYTNAQPTSASLTNTLVGRKIAAWTREALPFLASVDSTSADVIPRSIRSTRHLLARELSPSIIERGPDPIEYEVPGRSAHPAALSLKSYTNTRSGTGVTLFIRTSSALDAVVIASCLEYMQRAGEQLSEEVGSEEPIPQNPLLEYSSGGYIKITPTTRTQISYSMLVVVLQGLKDKLLTGGDNSVASFEIWDSHSERCD